MMDDGLNNKERIEYIDLLKGMGIILMVLGHIPVEQHFVRWLYAFHMPLFFFISGWLFNPLKKLTKEYITKRAKSLLIPYIVFSCAGYLLWLVEIRPSNLYDALVPLKAVIWINTDNMPIAGALWFLTAMFCCDILYRFLNMKIISKKHLHVVILLLAVYGFLEKGIVGHQLPYAVSVAFVGLLFYDLGYSLKLSCQKFEQFEIDTSVSKMSKSVLKLPIPYCVVLILLDIPLTMMNAGVSMRTGTYNNVILFLINSIVLILLFMNIAMRIDERHFAGAIGGGITYIKRIGKNSIVYLCCNEIIINVCRSVLQKVGFSGTLFIVLATMSSFAVLYIGEMILTKTRLRALIGREIY